MNIIPKVNSFGEEFGRSIGVGAGQGIESGLQNREKAKKLSGLHDFVKKEFGYNLGEVPEEFQEQVALKLMQNRLDQEENSASVAKENSDQTNKSLEDENKKKKIIDLLKKRGLSDDDAELYVELTAGGQTEFAKNILENRRRDTPTFGKKDTKSLDKLSDLEDMSPEKNNEIGLDQELQNIISDQDEGLLPAEKVKRGTERFNTGLEQYQEAGAKLRAASSDKQRLDILEKLSDSDKLPQDFGRANVDEEGNLRFPFASSPEAQRYIKTLNEFSVNAKESYGARVTNFDLQQYFRRFPTLANSKEGRKQIAKQMKIVNEINSIYYKNLKNVYHKAGGVRKIDADIAESLADKMTEPQVEKLVNKFDEVGKFTSKPSPQEFPGRKIRDTETGEVYESNGSDWIKVQ